MFRTGILPLLLLILAGCVKDHAVFVTSTKFGIDISQQADQPPKVLVGYKREEGIFLPAEHENARESHEDTASPATNPTAGVGDPPREATSPSYRKSDDTYSVLGYFCVMANPSLWDFIKGIAPFSEDVPDALQITSVFATGFPAQQLAQDESMREFFQEQITKSRLKHSDKRCK